MMRGACHAERVRVLFALVMAAAAAQAAPAPNQPRMRPFLGTAGITIGGNVAAATFCDAARRAILRLDDGNLLAVDATGAIKPLDGPGPVPAGSPMICDRKNQIWIAAGKKLAIVEAGKAPRFEPLAIPTDIRSLRLLDDDAVGIVDARGVVYRFTTVLEERWTTPAGRLPLELDGTGERAIGVSGGRVEILSASSIQPGPFALSATWLDNTTVLFGDRTGKLQRWTLGAPIDQLRAVAQVPPRGVDVFVRAVFQRAGARRIIVSRGAEGPLLVLTFDAQGELATTALHSRLPPGRRAIAAGDAPFAVFTVNDRAYLAGDLAKPSFVVDREHALANVDGMAFSPDGRTLAILGGERDVLLLPLDHHTKPARLEAAVPFVRGPLRWVADGTLVAGRFGVHMRWNPDGTFEDRRDRSIGFTDLANPITFDSTGQRLAIDRGQTEQFVAIPQRDLFVSRADIAGNLLLLRGSKRVEVHDLRAPPGTPPRVRTADRSFLREATLVGGPTAPAVMYIDDKGNLFLADGKTSDRMLDRFLGNPIIAVAPDGKRIAIATKNTLTLFDDRGRLVDKLPVRGDITSLAWSPNLHTLAVASKDGIDLWTFPR